MHIAHFCASPVDPSTDQGGVSNIVGALAREMAAAGRDVTVICGDHELGRRKQDAALRTYADGLRVETISDARRTPLRTVRALDDQVRALPPGAIAHVHAGFSVFADTAMRSLRRAGIPYVYTPHGKLSPGMFANRRRAKLVWWAAIAKVSANRAACIAVSAEGETALFRDLGIRAPVRVVPNGYRVPEGYAPEAGAPFAGEYILFLGYLDPRKQPELLIRSFAASKARDRVRLLLVGPDSYGHRATLEQAVNELGVKDKVVFYGPARGADKWSLIAHSRAMFLPSLAEGLPLVLIEAAGAGTPSVFSAASNAEFIASAGAGLKLSDFDIATWAAAIDTIVFDEAARRALSKGAADLGPRLSWPKIAAQWMSLYDEFR